MLLRPACPTDLDLMSRELGNFSDETLYRRFMSGRLPTRAVLRQLFDLDYRDHFAWVLVDPAGAAVVADGRFVRDPADPGSAEIAFTVADAHQGRGIGSLLMDAVVVAAEEAGVRRLTARLFSGNLAMRALLARFPVDWCREEPGVLSAIVTLDGGVSLRSDPAVLAQVRRTAARILAGAVHYRAIG